VGLDRGDELGADGATSPCPTDGGVAQLQPLADLDVVGLRQSADFPGQAQGDAHPVECGYVEHRAVEGGAPRRSAGRLRSVHGQKIRRLCAHVQLARSYELARRATR
jgi:hypothetical protein